uniref:Neurotransmitter gamma-aminobutyric acid n=1 Tax=Anisakis simplex TaxID=6269 RepID=A0A0G3XTA8_ANISI|nr:neurotransmitter gamma-aminobutyric acid [Anisakis simplex]
MQTNSSLSNVCPRPIRCLLLLTRIMISFVDSVELHIGGVFPLEAGSGGWAGGQACLPAVRMALYDVNHNPDVLPGYNLTLHHHNSKCQPGLAAKQMYELLYKPPVKLMLLVGCSPVTTVVADAAPVWNLVVLSYGASSPALSNRQRFPTLFRTHPTANMQNPTRIQLFHKFNWRKITILQSVEEVFTSTSKDLENQCRESGIRVERQSFYGDPTDAVKTLVRQDARIIVGLFYATEARRVLCQAYKHGLYGSKYVWFFIGWYEDTWFLPLKDEMLNCTASQMTAAAQYHITTESIMLSRDQKPTVSGMTGEQFQRRLKRLIETDPANTGGFPEAPLAYDAVWAVALAFNCTLAKMSKADSLENFTYNNTVIADQLFKCVEHTQFKGVSGQVMFSDSGDRIARTQIEQLQDGRYQILGTYDTTTQYLDWFFKEKFPTANGLAPPDSTIIRESLLTVTIELYIAVCVLAITGMLMALTVFIFNLKNSHRGIILHSQPQCNNVLIAGCVLCSVSLLLMGLPAQGITFPRQSFTLLCHSRISILMIGFTFAYGSMFAKVWIVYRMGASENREAASRHNNSDEDDSFGAWEGIRTLIASVIARQAMVSSALRKVSSHAYGSLMPKKTCILNQPIPAGKFYWVIAAFFMVDFFIITAWIALDPLQREEKRFPLQEPPAGTNEDVMLLPILELCQSNHQEIWIGIIMGYKCLLLIFGLLLAYESRNLKLRFVNDSRFVSLAIYNVAILSLLTGPVVTLLIRSQADANFAFVSFTVLLCTYISIALVFLPKILYIYRVPESSDQSSVSARAHGVAQIRTKLTKIEQKRYEQLLVENTELKRQIEIRERKISECRERIRRRLTNNGNKISNELSLNSEENAACSSPTTLTTTALIELQPKENDAKQKKCQIENNDNTWSSCSDEILL